MPPSQRTYAQLAPDLLADQLDPDRVVPPFPEWLDEVTPLWQWHVPHLQLIQHQLHRITTGEINRLMLFLPPRHAKSETATVRYPAWRLEDNPELRIIVAAYNQTLANKFSRKTRRIVRSRLPLSTERNAAEDWETTKGGGVRAVGVGGGVTGQGGDLIIIDDPVKNREEADSLTYRDKVWDWYTDDLYTRLEPGAAMILIMCMTGDTPVLMADGTERPLRDIKVGDQVATYDNGKLATSTVMNHKSNGLDSVFKIKTTCGKIVYANERHPFLVQEHGQLKWIRLKHLTTGQRIVTVKDNGASGRVKPASLRTATSLSAHGDTAYHTTTRNGGPMAIDHHHSTRRIDAIYVSNIDTESPPQNTMLCSPHKTVSALSANSRQETMCERIGAASSASTTATKRTPFEGFCATTATLLPDMPRQRQPHSPLPNTSDFTTAQIESIEPAGVEEVFDIQIERTENFIANGLVSHNTRWHQDDLAGRILESDDGPNWTVVHLPALAMEHDALGRAPGEPLWPERYDVDDFIRIRGSIGDRGWYALYQGIPQPDGGAIFLSDWWSMGRNRFDAGSDPLRRMVGARWLSWDTGIKDNDTSAYTACTVGELTQDYQLLIREVYRERLTFPALPEAIEHMARRYNYDGKLSGILIEDKASGTSAYQTLLASSDDWLRGLIIPFQPSGSKEIRANQAAVWCRNDMVLLPFPSQHVPWLGTFEHELFNAPQSAYMDQVDAFSQLIIYLEHYLSAGWHARGITDDAA